MLSQFVPPALAARYAVEHTRAPAAPPDVSDVLAALSALSTRADLAAVLTADASRAASLESIGATARALHARLGAATDPRASDRDALAPLLHRVRAMLEALAPDEPVVLGDALRVVRAAARAGE